MSSLTAPVEMPDVRVTRPTMRYHGGKWRLAPWIISQMPAHQVYVEPFGGAASVLMRKPRSKGEIYNERDGNIVNVFRILRDPEKARELTDLLRLTPFAREEFEASYEPATSDLDGAWKTIVRSFMGFSTDATTRGCRTGFRANKTSGKTPATEWATYADSISFFTQRLRGVIIENRNAFEIIASQDSQETLFFVDPPYVSSTRGNGLKHGYAYEFNDNDHRMLATLLRSLKGRVMVCGYWSRLYEELFDGWAFEEAQCYANGCHERTERVWRNF